MKKVVAHWVNERWKLFVAKEEGFASRLHARHITNIGSVMFTVRMTMCLKLLELHG